MNNELYAKTVLRLVKDHKRRCTDEVCNISLMVAGNLYKKLMKRDLTPEEENIFM